MADRTLAEHLCRRYYGAVYRQIRRAVRAEDRAVDLTQEVFLRLVRSLPRYEARHHEAGWVFTIVRHVVATHQRRAALARRVTAVEDDPPGETPATQLVEASLHEALEALPAGARQLLELREGEGFSYAEIAEVLGTTAGAVRTRLARVRRQLAQTVVRR